MSLPSLQTIGGPFSIKGAGISSDLESIDFPSLTLVGPSFTITGHDHLPTRQAEELRDQLLAAGWTGSVIIFGNDDAGTCP